MTGAEKLPSVSIDDLSAQGDGVGRLPDGRAVFVPGTVPGDVVTVRLTREKSRWARGEAAQLLTPSPDRREPPCRYFDRCGGCQLQHMTYRAQLAWKGRRIRDALERIGGLSLEGLPGLDTSESPVPVEPAPAEYHYRNRVSFTLKRPRNGRVLAGFHQASHPGRVVDVNRGCLLPESTVAEVWPRLRAGWGPGARLLPPGGELRLTLRAASGGVVLVVEGGEPGGQAVDLVQAVDGLLAVAHRPKGGALVHLAGPETVQDEVLGIPVPVASSAFVQVNREMGEALHLSVVKELGNPRDRTVVDAYCGVGAYGRRLAHHGARVVGLELDPYAVAAVRRAAVPGFEVRRGRVEYLLEDALPADWAILNPPRAGLDEAIPPLLCDRPPVRVLYISCDPATLARDLARLSPSFRIRRVQGFDLFPQTTHVETAVTLDALTLCET